MPKGEAKSSSFAADKKIDKRTQLNQRVLRQVHQVYTDYHKLDSVVESKKRRESKHGLVHYSNELTKCLQKLNVKASSGEALDVSLHAPRAKVHVMIVGNHSSGKSSFINWYIDDNMLKTSMALETQGIIFVTQGQHRDHWDGDGTLRQFPEIQSIANRLGNDSVLDCLKTKFSPSDARLFSTVTFVDTPGLVDGNVKYPFDVNRGILYMSDYVDKILIFLDPMGKATVTRTMEVVASLQKHCQSKTSFYMTKADQIDRISDIADVAVQTVRDMTAATETEHSFKLPTIFIPTLATAAKAATMKCENHIGKLCEEIENCVRVKAQDNLKRLVTDAQNLEGYAQQAIAADNDAKEAKATRSHISLVLYIVALAMVVASFASMLIVFQAWLPSSITEQLSDVLTALGPYLAPSGSVGGFKAVLQFVITFCIVVFLARFVGRRATHYTTLSAEERATVEQIRSYCAEARDRHEEIWDEFQSAVNKPDILDQ